MAGIYASSFLAVPSCKEVEKGFSHQYTCFSYCLMAQSAYSTCAQAFYVCIINFYFCFVVSQLRYTPCKHVGECEGAVLEATNLPSCEPEFPINVSTYNEYH